MKNPLLRLEVALLLGLLGLIQLPAPAYAAPVAGDLYCWGDNTYGQLGNATNADSVIPAKIRGLTKVVAVSACNEHSLALTAEGTVWAWGSNSSGQLGTNLVDESNTPLQVAGLDDVVAVAAGTG
jgi:alpha-tubulin suppressor-like RCC1 family protein